MNHLLGSSWGRNLLAALLAAILFALLGWTAGTPPAVTLFAAAIFGAFLVLIVQLGEVLQILWSSRRSAVDVGETIRAEVETPAGQQELKQMGFAALLTVAVVQEFHLTLFKRDRPLWAFEFFGIGEGRFPPRDYGWFNRYLEWMLMVVLAALTVIAAFLLAAFVNSLASPSGVSGTTLVCAGPAFILGLLIVFPVGLFLASVIRRMFILYSFRADESKIR